MEITTVQWTFRARTAGPDDGRPVLLLHGFPQTSRAWDSVIDELAGAGCRAVAFDQRGYSPGARPGDPDDYAPEPLVNDVLEVADALGWDRFDLVGHDFGGAIAWMVAGHHPDRVRTLSVASTPHPAAFRASYRKGGGDQHGRSGYMRAFREAQRGEPEAQLLADDAAILRALYGGLPADLVDAYVADLSEPTASLVTGPYRFEVLEGVGHWIPELAADRFATLLLEHLVVND